MQQPFPLYALKWLLLTIAVSAQSITDSVSFGQRHPIAADGGSIPGWQAFDENHQIQILSDRIILTPPVPGNARGAIWSDNTIAQADWTAELEFRASGQDQGTGNLNIWFTKEKGEIGTNSVYTVEKYDGLALVIDQYGSTGGKVRGFLNDGSQNFKAHTSLESLAFGHCDYAYRNLGRPSKISISNHNGLTVSVDDRECFRTDHVSLPAGYHFGITAATADNPDSFEINKFVVSSSSGAPPPPQQQPQTSSWSSPPPLQRLDRLQLSPDKPAEQIKGSDPQFADLHNRLQETNHAIERLFAEFDNVNARLQQQHAEMLNSLSHTGSRSGAQTPGSSDAAISDLRNKIEGIERTVQQIQKDVEGRDYKQHISELQLSLDSLRGGITEHLPETMTRLIRSSAPRMGMFVFVVVAVQIMLAGAYIVYKRRRDRMPKKYL
ncbi:hypothetical protein BAUCODRAFT_34632 [Baudoinia panamericana UAMH 10762]|uniref:L-type lectin-like domain-containing protein n=1 Tax=Baudoinia panamericana (strain UAMH 10762) TaxID=717646 RepID=M2NAI7_BAUPA|nr:uncharacterized protein BAUCODRAFT_34632 [Baudoinia panamericana UAMH 10762]EMC95865.1 hypothetical protein BAUCODRAFT_34632 [Baudoinia panamericana UAMH 10762]